MQWNQIGPIWADVPCKKEVRMKKSDLFDALSQDGFNFVDQNDQDNGGHGHLPPTQLNATLDPTATDGHGHILSGTGIPATGWEKEDAGHNELATQISFRTGDFIQPSAVEHNGTLDFTGRAGTQIVDPAHNVGTANANRGAMAESWSFDTGANGAGGQTQQQFLASGGHEEIKIDLDPGAGFKFLTLTAVYDPVHNPTGSHVVWEAADNAWAAQGIAKGQIVVADDGGNATTTQNTTNLAFFNPLIDHDPHTPGIQGGAIAPAGDYEFNVTMTDNHGHQIASIHNDLHLV